jgi:hypothetical protein
MTKRAKDIKEAKVKAAKDKAKRDKAIEKRKEILLEAYPDRLFVSWHGPNTIDLDDAENIELHHLELNHEDLGKRRGGKLIAEYVLVRKGKTFSGIVTDGDK